MAAHARPAGRRGKAASTPARTGARGKAQDARRAVARAQKQPATVPAGPVRLQAVEGAFLTVLLALTDDEMAVLGVVMGRYLEKRKAAGS